MAASRYSEIDSFAAAENRLAGRDCVKIAHNTHLTRLDADSIAVTLHSTHVVTYYRDGRVRLYTGGWKTVTTKHRMNAFSPIRVWSERRRWCVAYPSFDHKQAFDGDEVVINTNAD